MNDCLLLLLPEPIEVKVLYMIGEGDQVETWYRSV